MPIPTLTELVCVLDRSGSMEPIREDTIGGFNTFLDAQRGLPGEARLTLVLFDHDYDLALDGVPLAEVAPLTAETYVPRGSTALLDAVGRTIDDVGARLAATSEAERPGTVLVCVVTDGHENASGDYTRDRIKEMVEHQQEVYGWQFQYLGANVDAFAEADSLGIAQADAVNWTADADGAGIAFSIVSDRAASVRHR